MAPIELSKIDNLHPTKKRKRGEKRYDPPVTLVSYTPEFIKGSGKWHLGRKGMECVWCNRMIPHDGRPFFACDYHWWKELWWRTIRGKTISEKDWEHYDATIEVLLTTKQRWLYK